MKVLVTGATGYIGKRLISVLLANDHEVIACVRNKKRFAIQDSHMDNLTVFEVDFAEQVDVEKAPLDFDVAFYLIHSMSNASKHFEKQEQITAENFKNYVNASQAKQVVYLSGIVHSDMPSAHLRSRKNVESTLKSDHYALTILAAGIIVGSGSSSFEIIRDLVEKLPFMICPKWVNTKTQPLAASDVMKLLKGVMLNEQTYNKTFEIGGPQVLTYKQLLKRYAKVRGLSSTIVTVPILTPRLSSFWLTFVTSTNIKLARLLVDSLKCETVAENNVLPEMLELKPKTYEEAIEAAFEKIEQNMVVSSWKDSFSSSMTDQNILNYINVPKYGCFKDIQKMKIKNSPERTVSNFWSIGGKKGWYYATWLWKMRGYADKVVGGVGLRRGRTNPNKLYTGDSLDFWRIILADEEHQRLLLYAEMRLPGEAWLEFKVEDNHLLQEATFRPKGLFGRLYWYSLLPFHIFIFKNMAKKIVTI